MAQIICHCAVCEQPIFKAEEQLADHHVYKCGELSYIELAHLECGRTENERNSDNYWGF